MTPRAYYNEKDAYAAQWLRKLAPRLSAGRFLTAACERDAAADEYRL